MNLKRYWVLFPFLLLMAIGGLWIACCKSLKGVTVTEKIKAWGNVSIEHLKFDNGLQVILALKPDVPVFAYYTWFDVGSRYEKKGKTGIAHFFEHLLFKESKNLKEGQFDHLMEENGAQTNASTWVDWTNYYEVLPSDEDKMELVIKLEAERMVNMILNEKQVNSEREVIKNERRFRVDNDVDGTMNEQLENLAYMLHPYGQPIIGWMEDINNLKLQDCIDFYQRYYAPNNAVVVIVGNFNKKKVIQWLHQYYGHLKSSQLQKLELQEEPSQQKPRELIIHRDDIDVEKALYAYHVPQYHHPDIPVIELLGEILFNGEGSRLYKKMIIDLESAASISGGVAHLKDPALFQISVSMRKGQPIQKSHDHIFKEIEKVQKQGVMQEELDRAKNRFEVDYYRSLETVSGKARALGSYQVVAGDYKEAIHLMKRYAAVTKEDIQKAAQTYLHNNNRNIVVALPKRTQ